MLIDCGQIITTSQIAVSTEQQIGMLTDMRVGSIVKVSGTGKFYEIIAVNDYGVPTNWKEREVSTSSSSSSSAEVTDLKNSINEANKTIRKLTQQLETANEDIKSTQQRLNVMEKVASTESAAFIQTKSPLTVDAAIYDSTTKEPLFDQNVTCSIQLIGISDITRDDIIIGVEGLAPVMKYDTDGGELGYYTFSGFNDDGTLNEASGGFVLIQFDIPSNHSYDEIVIGTVSISIPNASGGRDVGSIVVSQRVCMKNDTITYKMTLKDGEVINGTGTLIRQDAIDLYRVDIVKLEFLRQVDLGRSAFSGCTSLREIVFNENTGNGSWRNDAFSGCTRLRNLDLVDINFSAVGAFSQCTGLETVTLNRSTPGSIFIGNRMFDGCTSLHTITLGDNITEGTMFGTSFDGCSNLERIVSANGSVFTQDHINNYTFYGCRKLKSICFDISNLTEIGLSAFLECESFEQIKNMSLDNLKYIGTSAFQRSCIESFEAINFPINDVDNQAFSGCENLVSVKLNKGNLQLKDRVFSGCSSLASVKDEDNKDLIPQLTSIGASAFCDCSSLVITSLNNNLKRIEEMAFQKCFIKATSLPSSLTYIGSRAFFGCPEVSFKTIPSGVTAIEDYTFYESGIKEITIPSSVKSIGYGAFGYSSLNKVTFAEGLILIDGFAFREACLKSVTIPNSCTSIGEWAFESNGIETLVIGSGITQLEYYTFARNYKLKDIYIRRDSVTPIGFKVDASSGTKSVFFGVGVEYFDSNIGATNLHCTLHLPFAEGTTAFGTAKENYMASDWSDRIYNLRLGTQTITPFNGSPYTVPAGWVIKGSDS